ncbi:MAG: NUDIX domain-containing protein [Planctomycetota bacterium]|nr:NUDIX domain-containing protein [Planctomycetota bacterium]
METPEQVLVVPRSLLFSGGEIPQGLIRDGLNDLVERIGRNYRFVDRPRAEDDPSLKQIIPYSYLSWDDKVFLLRRLATQTEVRLHDKLSIGVGGHINPGDPETGSILEGGALRELHEEIDVRSTFRLHLEAFLNDESNSVGQVHFGIVYRVALEGGDVEVREKDLMEGRFVPLSDLLSYKDRMETWSSILTDHLLAHRPS